MMMDRRRERYLWESDRGLREWARIEGVAPGEVRHRVRERCAWIV